MFGHVRPKSDIFNDLVFQGHADTVTSALFIDSDTIVSGSDDRTVKFWDMRNMHTPTLVIRHSAGVNKMAVSPNGAAIAVPLDNRYIQLYNLSGHRMCRFTKIKLQTCWVTVVTQV